MIESNAFIFGWNHPRAGREGHAAELFGTTVSFFEKQQKAGTIEHWEPVFMRAHGGDMNGFFYVKATNQNVNKLMNDETFTEITMRANMCLEGVCVVNAYSGLMVQEMMTRWSKLIPR